MRLTILILLLNCNTIFGQTIYGTVINEKSELPVEYVNIGILGKNIGTVSDNNGKYSLLIDSQYDEDSLLFSCVGYLPYTIKVADLKKDTRTSIHLKEKIYAINEVIIKPKIFKPQVLGSTSRNKNVSAGFKDNLLGYELGILMKSKKSAFIKKVDINISQCDYDTIFYRLNIYEVRGKNIFDNILSEPIYIKLSKQQVKDKIEINLEPKNIVVHGDFLITLEHVKNLGEGRLYFCSGLANKTYYRKTSQGKWETAPVGVSISVIADVEK